MRVVEIITPKFGYHLTLWTHKSLRGKTRTGKEKRITDTAGGEISPRRQAQRLEKMTRARRLKSDHRDERIGRGSWRGNGYGRKRESEGSAIRLIRRGRSRLDLNGGRPPRSPRTPFQAACGEILGSLPFPRWLFSGLALSSQKPRIGEAPRRAKATHGASICARLPNRRFNLLIKVIRVEFFDLVLVRLCNFVIISFLGKIQAMELSSNVNL